MGSKQMRGWYDVKNLYVSQRGGFATIEGKVLAHKHRFKNKKARTNCDSEWV